MENDRTEVARRFLLKRAESNRPETELFLKHHRSELPSDYFVDTFGVEEPTGSTLVRGLLAEQWTEDETQTEFVDFRLPGRVSQYILTVEFDATGAPIDARMES